MPIERSTSFPLCERAVAWHQSKQVDVQLSYYKGLAAQLLGNREEAVYRFMFAVLSEEQLKTLRTPDAPVKDGTSPDIHESPVESAEQIASKLGFPLSYFQAGDMK